jgi:thiamine biosynthesis lipoprotein ApbE
VRTGGALDPSVEEVSRIWKRAAAEGRRPESAELAAAVAAIQQVHWAVDPVASIATHLSGTPLVLNSFTKSYIVDRAASAGLAAGATGIVVNGRRAGPAGVGRQRRAAHTPDDRGAGGCDKRRLPPRI